MTAAATATDPREVLSQDEIPTAALMELRRLAHCSMEERSLLEQAIADFGSIAKKLSSENKAEVRKGTCLWVLGKVEDAFRVLEPARQSKERAYILGLSYLDLGRVQDAVKQLHEAVDADSGDENLKLALLEARIRAGAAEEAEKMIGQLEKKLGRSAEYHYLRGLQSDYQGYFDDAQEAYERALEIEPGYAKAIFRMAHMLDLRGEDARALELYEQLRKLRPCHVHTMINLGTLYEDRGEYERAAECYRAVLENYPNHARAKLYLRDAVSSSSMFYDEDAARREAKVQQILSQPVAEISCSPRVRAALQRMNVTTLGDLAQKSEEDLLGLPNFGRTSLRELKELLAARGLSLSSGGGGAGPTPVAVPAVAGASSEETLKRNLSEFEWSGRIRKLIEKLSLVTVGDLAALSETDLLKNKNLGMTSIKEIQRKLSELGLAMREE